MKPCLPEPARAAAGRALLLWAVCALGTASFVLGGEPPARIIGLWERFEEKVTNSRSYADPFRDVVLHVTYTPPLGDEIKFWGFHDGGQTWKFRFMPHLKGVWRYRASFSDGTPGPSGSFRVGNSSLPGRLHANRANPIWFSGDVWPILIRGLHVGDRFFAGNWADEKRAGFLDWAQRQGYNFLSIASHYLNRDAEGRGRGWETPRLWPLDAREYQELERVLDDLAARRMYVYPFAGFFGQKSEYPRDPHDQELYLRYTLARIGPSWNVILNVAGPEPNVGKGWMTSTEVERLGRQIRDLDVFHHLLSVHNRKGDDPYRDADWNSYGTIQGPKTLSREELSAGLLKNHHPKKPLLAQETLWSGNKFHPEYTDEDLRKNAFVIHFSAAALVFGDFAGDSSSGFSGTMEPDMRQQHRHDIVKRVWDFFEGIPYFDMKPRQDLVSRGYCLAWPGRDYLVYLETGGPVDVAVEGGPFAVTWINARNTSETRAAGTTVNGRALTAPDDGDWLLRLTRTNTGLPDQIHLSWDDNPATSLTVTWHTASPNNPATVQFRPAGSSPDWSSAAGESIKSPGDGWLHRAHIKGLSPDTRYEYRVSSDHGVTPAASHTFDTRTAPAGRAGFTAAFVSDTGLIGRIDGNTTGTRRIMEEISRVRPLFVLGAGDYAYANRDKRSRKAGDAVDEWFVQWQDVIARMPLMAQYGNHEIFLDETFDDWAPRFAHPAGHDDGRNFSFDVAGVHFTGLFVPGNNLTDPQLAWLDADLASARQRGARWLVVFQHEPIYAHGRSHPARPPIRAKLAPIFERRAVDLHLSSHDQNYERTYPLLGVPDQIKITSQSPDRYRQGEGVIYAKVSPAGKRSEIGNQFSRFTTAQQPHIARRETGFHHYALLHVTAGGELKLEVFRLPDGEGAPSLVEAFTIEPRT